MKAHRTGKEMKDMIKNKSDEGNETADQLAKDGGGHMAAAKAVQKKQ